VSITTDLDAIRARVDKATAGPWARPSWNPKAVMSADWAVEEGDPENRAPFSMTYSHSETDAEFIAHAREDVPFLLDLVDELRRQVNVWKGGAE